MGFAKNLQTLPVDISNSYFDAVISAKAEIQLILVFLDTRSCFNLGALKKWQKK